MTRTLTRAPCLSVFPLPCKWHLRRCCLRREEFRCVEAVFKANPHDPPAYMFNNATHEQWVARRANSMGGVSGRCAAGPSDMWRLRKHPDSAGGERMRASKHALMQSVARCLTLRAQAQQHQGKYTCSKHSEHITPTCLHLPCVVSGWPCVVSEIFDEVAATSPSQWCSEVA